MSKSFSTIEDDDNDASEDGSVSGAIAAKATSSDARLSETTSRTSTIEQAHRSSSYGDELGYFLKSKSAVQNARNKTVFSMLDKFGEYENSCGILDYEGYFKESERGIYSIRFSNDGKKLVVGFGSGTVLLFGAKSHQLYQKVFEGKECGYPINCIRFHPKKRRKFFVCCTDTITMCSSRSKDPKLPVITEKDNQIYSIDLNSVGNTLASAGKDAVIRLYDANNFGIIKEYKREDPGTSADVNAGFHTNRVFAVRFNPDDENMFATGGWDKVVKVWDVRAANGCVDTIVGPHIFGESVDIKREKLLIGAWTAKKSIKLWDLRNLKQEFLVCIPQNTPPLKEGYFISGLSFFDGDRKGDIVCLASMTSKSYDILSLKQNVILYSFMTGNVVVGNHSHGTKVSYGGMLQTLRLADFYMYGMPYNPDHGSI